MNFKNKGIVRSVFTFVQVVGSKIYNKRIIKAETLPFKSIDSYHLKKCKKELETSIKDIPYYDQNVYREAVRTTDLDSFLKLLPVIDKQAFINNENLFFPSDWAKGKTKHTTSGSSGTPLTIYSSIPEKLYAHSMILNQIKKVTGSWGMKNTLYLSGFYVNSDLNEDNFFTRDSLFNNTYVSIYHFKKENADKYLNVLQKYNPHIIYGYASAINELATMLSTYDNFKHNIKIIISTSEILTEKYRKNIENVFNIKVTDMYGSQEGGHLAFECQYGIKHIHPGRGIIEVRKDNTISRTGIGEAIITAINRPSFPLYRYNLKDVVEIEAPKGKCSCGLETYVIKGIEGRSEDMVITSDGRKIGYLNFHATKDLIGIRESQLVQLHYEKFIFKCVFDEGIDTVNKEKIYKSIQDKIEERIGLNISVIFEDVTVIRKTAKGKSKAVVVENFLNNEEH